MSSQEMNNVAEDVLIATLKRFQELLRTGQVSASQAVKIGEFVADRWGRPPGRVSLSKSYVVDESDQSELFEQIETIVNEKNRIDKEMEKTSRLLNGRASTTGGRNS